MSRALFNHFVVTTWQFGKNQHSTVVRAPLGGSFLDGGRGLKYWTGNGWSKRAYLAKKFPANGKSARRAMNRAALALVRS